MEDIDIKEKALDYVLNTGGLPDTIEKFQNALIKFYEWLQLQSTTPHPSDSDIDEASIEFAEKENTNGHDDYIRIMNVYIEGMKAMRDRMNGETLSDRIFKLANELALAGHGDEAVLMHQICNKLTPRNN